MVYYHSKSKSDKISMKDRQQELLQLVVENHIITAEPIGSRFLLSQSNLNCGEATVRNDLRALEEEGYLIQPHTSAGRIPTEKGYRFFVENSKLKKIAKINNKENDVLGMSLGKDKDDDYFQTRKNLAKSLAELSQEAVLLAFNLNSVYYTGLSNLFAKPELKQLNEVVDISQVFDHCEDCLQEFLDEVEEDVSVYFGKDHPFGRMLSVVSVPFENKNKEQGLIMIMGLQRMDYKHNYALLKKVKELI